MKTTIVVAALFFATSGFAAQTDSLVIGPVTLTLGMSQDALRSELPAGFKFGWERDRLPQPVEVKKTEAGTIYSSHGVRNGQPVTLIYSDLHGEHGYLTDPAGERIASVVFENGKLTRVTRSIVAREDSGSAAALVAALAPLLAQWKSVRVESTHAIGLDQIVFSSGARSLIVTSAAGRATAVENLGRGDIPSAGD